jgi:long-subunit acyl-CoA synthetase (AMP-forming)
MTTNLPQANAAYQSALAALAATHASQNVLISATPVDWDAYYAAGTAVTAAQNTAQAALTVYQTAILDSADVTALVVELQEDTDAMRAATEALDNTANTLNALASAADAVTTVLGAIAKFV